MTYYMKKGEMPDTAIHRCCQNDQEVIVVVQRNYYYCGNIV
jgi:hypothetical protein